MLRLAFFVPFAAVLAAAPLAMPAAAQQSTPAPQLDLEQKTLLRCSAVFAIVAYDQQHGDANALAYPPLAERGREYFVQATATLMEALQLDHDQVQALFATEVTQLQQANAAASDKKRYLASLMQPCQLSLEASGL
ncbi:MAG: hypothetical protein J7496_06045 [Novosphingobium sp.]|nr:hypothetical protein [Novosphingobium sp.]